MPVELDVSNPDHRLEPGSFTQVLWPVRRPYPTLFVPSSAVTTNLQRTFVIRVRDGKTEWVDVVIGATQANLVEVFGNLHAGDEVVVRATDELQPETPVAARLASSM
jgi:multidrug efflux pump subunit AcrA (membrane-fusion protein)